jgi:hypothetical protein
MGFFKKTPEQERKKLFKKMMAAKLSHDWLASTAFAAELHKLRDPRGVEFLASSLKDPDPILRPFAAVQLQSIGDSRGLEWMFGFLDRWQSGKDGRGEPLHAMYLVELLAKLDFLPLVRVLTEPDGALREKAMGHIRFIADRYYRDLHPNEAMRQHLLRLGAAAQAALGAQPAQASARGERKIGILFDIAELGDGLYGRAAYGILFDAIDSRRIADCTLMDGDTNATLEGHANQYCIAIESSDPAKISAVKDVIATASAKGLLPLASRFINTTQVDNEPLVVAVHVNAAGEPVGDKTGWITAAWKESREKYQGLGA